MLSTAALAADYLYRYKNDEAADVERSVSVDIVAAIDTLQSEIVETERSIEERLNEAEAVGESFQRDIDRFALLLDKVELRKRILRANAE